MNDKRAKELRRKAGVFGGQQRQRVGYRIDKDGSRHCVGLRADYLRFKAEFKRGGGDA